MAMVHPHDCAGTDGTILFHGVDDSDDGGDKHLTHLSPVVDSCLKERREQNKCVDDNKDDGIDNSVDDSAGGGNKHLTHLSPVVDSCLKERREKNKCVDDNNGDGVDNSDGG
eukprot:3255203-Ditylum_brightwellii.AAC.1